MSKKTKSHTPHTPHTPEGTPGEEAMPNPLQNIAASISQGTASGVGAYAALGQAAELYATKAVTATNAVLNAQAKSLKATQGSAAAQKLAEVQKLSAVLQAVKSKAVIKAVEATAEGLQALASFNFWSAAQDFASAALWGTIAGSQIASAASGGGRSSSAAAAQRANQNQGGSSAGTEGGMSAGAMSAAHPPTGHLTVSIIGDNEAGQWLAKTLTNAVERHGAQLTASSTKRSPYA